MISCMWMPTDAIHPCQRPCGSRSFKDNVSCSVQKIVREHPEERKKDLNAPTWLQNVPKPKHYMRTYWSMRAIGCFHEGRLFFKHKCHHIVSAAFIWFPLARKHRKTSWSITTMKTIPKRPKGKAWRGWLVSICCGGFCRADQRFLLWKI